MQGPPWRALIWITIPPPSSPWWPQWTKWAPQLLSTHTVLFVCDVHALHLSTRLSLFVTSFGWQKLPWSLLHLCPSQHGLGTTPLGFSTAWGLTPPSYWSNLSGQLVCLSYKTMNQLRPKMGSLVHSGSSCWAQCLHKVGPSKCLLRECIKYKEHESPVASSSRKSED